MIIVQKGYVSLLPTLVIAAGLVVGVYFIDRSSGFLSKALDVFGPSKSGSIKIPVRSPQPSASMLASSSPKASATSSATPKASASASASVKPLGTASPSASPKK